jgi:uncharacterized membrane protein YhiD involved in acid resistance
MNKIKFAVGKRIPKEWLMPIEKYTSHILLLLFIVLVFGTTLMIYLNKSYGYLPDPSYTRNSFLIIIIMVVFNLFLNETVREMLVEETSLSKRIESLTISLKTSAESISKIEEEIKRRETLVSKLEEDATTYAQLTRLKKPEVEAVAQTLRMELKQEGRKSLIKEILVAAIFFLLGWLL